MLADSHAHLDFLDFKDDLDEVISRASNAGVKKIINIGADLDLSEKAIEIAEKYPNIWATVGVHAEYADDHELTEIKDKILGLVKKSKRVVAIGECGPDYHWNNKNREKQLKLFRLQLELAQKLSLPVILHIRNNDDEKAAEDAFDIIKTVGFYQGVVHCFTLNNKWAERFLDLGFYLGLTGIITYKNAESLCRTVESVPMKRILIETDAPYLAPQSVRGKRNEPAFVTEVAEKIAAIKKRDFDEVAEITTQNCEKLFSI